MTPDEKLDTIRRVNADVNRRVKYVTDQDQFGRSEWWQTTHEVLKNLAGDCEDQAICKAGMLWGQFGFSDYEVTLAAGFVVDGRARYGHAVCLWWESPIDPYLLDNGAVSAEVVRYSAIRDRLDLWACCNRRKTWRLLRRP